MTISQKKELFRKALHTSAIFIPPLSMLSFHLILYSLILISIIYTISELMRMKNINFPLITTITLYARRENEKNKITLAPLLLAIGVILSLIIFPRNIAFATVSIVAIGDTFASIIGRKFGKNKLPYNKDKSLQGLLACLISSFLISLLYINYQYAMLCAIVATIIESLPVKEYDNLLIPLITGGMCLLIQTFFA